MAWERHADVLLCNARVVTMRQYGPSSAWFVAVNGGTISGVGDAEEAARYKGPHTREVDCQGMTLIPGFNDAHCHLMAFASSLLGVDCRPESAGSITQVVEAIGRRANRTRTGNWIRAYGYDEFFLAEKRHPTRWELDGAAPHHPVRLDHRTGHASVLNSRALELLNISWDTPDPVDGIIEREETGGEPTGVLYEMGGLIRARMVSHLDEEELTERVRTVNDLLLSRGITSVQDAGAGNDLRRWQTFRKLKDGGHLRPRVSMMVGAQHAKSFFDAGLGPDSGDDDLKLGAVKFMLSLATGTLHPIREELQHMVSWAHEKGFQLAFHAVEHEAVEAATDSILNALVALPRPYARHRIEHCSECPAPVLKVLKASGALVVTQPRFIYDNGEKYLAMVDEGLLPDLYPLGSLTNAGVLLAAGSDAPVSYPDPLLGIYSAVTRRTRDGSALSPSQAITADAALKMHTANGAYASFDERVKGSIEVGKLADLVLLDGDPRAVEPEAIKEISVAMTMVGGDVVWES